MYYDLNDHTDDVPTWDGVGTARPTWGEGLPTAADAWKNHPGSPIKWYWSSANHRMMVGVYPVSRGVNGYVGRVRLYDEPGPINDADLGCSTPQEIHYARLFINRNLIDGTPPWFFFRLVQHELGHVFGLCHPGGGGYRDSVMINPHPDNIAGCDWDPSLGHFPYDECFDRTPSDIPTVISWGADPPSNLDFGSQTCQNGSLVQITGVRCIYNNAG